MTDDEPTATAEARARGSVELRVDALPGGGRRFSFTLPAA